LPDRTSVSYQATSDQVSAASESLKHFIYKMY
jgi:hypothetical protein